ncbi:MAG: class I SAM-dependent methyltransferase [Candidatus Limnocylindrales bacterium]
MTAPRFYGSDSLNVATYDQRTVPAADGPLAADIAFYIDLGRHVGGPVLDLGCGTGRVAWPLARAGFEVVGLDRSPHMLARAESKRADVPEEVSGPVQFVEGDMSSFALDRRFGLSVIPGRSFQILLEPEEQRACLDSIRDHLRPGGILALQLFDPLLETLVPGEQPAPSPDRGTVTHPGTGNDVTVHVIRRRNDPLRQVFEEEWEFTERGPDGAVLRRENETLAMRWTYRYEMRYLLELSGFEVVGEYSDFQGARPAYGREQVWVARRP